MKDSAERSEANTLLKAALEAVELGKRASPGPWIDPPSRGVGTKPCPYLASKDGDGEVIVGRFDYASEFDKPFIAHAGTHYAALAAAYVEVRERANRIADNELAVALDAVETIQATLRHRGQPQDVTFHRAIHALRNAMSALTKENNNDG